MNISFHDDQLATKILMALDHDKDFIYETVAKVAFDKENHENHREKGEFDSPRCSCYNAIQILGTSPYAKDFKSKIAEIAFDRSDTKYIRGFKYIRGAYYMHAVAIKALGLSGCAKEFKNEIEQIAFSDKGEYDHEKNICY